MFRYAFNQSQGRQINITEYKYLWLCSIKLLDFGVGLSYWLAGKILTGVR